MEKPISIKIETILESVGAGVPQQIRQITDLYDTATSEGRRALVMALALETITQRSYRRLNLRGV